MLHILEQKYEKNRTVWRIIPSGKQRLDTDSLPQIAYGRLPQNFIQEVPEKGAALPLEEGKLYEARGAPSLMPDAVVRFKIENGKVHQVSIPK